MKYAVISDTHGNFEAMKSAILDAQANAANGFIFLGDYGTDFLEIHDCLELMRKIKKVYPTYIIKGNREDYVLNYLEGKHPEWDNEPTKKAIILTCKSLTEEDIKDIYAMPNSLVIEPIGAKPIFIKHIMPLTKEEQTLIKEKKISTVIFGHSHSSGKWNTNGIDIYNPGSCGLTDDAIAKATYALLEFKDNEYCFEIKSVDYDIDKETKKLSSCPDLANNSAHWPELLSMAMLCGKQLTVYYIVELQRLIFLSKQNHEINYPPVSEEINMFMQLKNTNVDPYGNYLPVIDFRYRKNFGDMKLKIDKSMKFPLKLVDRTFTSVKAEIYELAYRNTLTYFQREMESQRAYNNLYEKGRIK